MRRDENIEGMIQMAKSSKIAVMEVGASPLPPHGGDR